jgi:NitT/TauT family transport system substrate-binding protein
MKRVVGKAVRTVTVAMAAAFLPFLAGAAAAKDAVTFQISWLAESEFGGYYQALAAGIYDSYDLDVTLRQGGPQINTAQRLVSGTTDFALISGNAVAISLVQQDAPFVAVAALFQKDPRILLSHPEAGFKTLADLKGKPILVSNDGVQTFWKFLKLKYGYTDEQIRPYTANLAPFLVDKTLTMQGYISNEPLGARNSGVEPTIFLLADEGYSPYSQLLSTSKKMIAEKPQLVQRFVDASIKGWYAFLYGDNAKGMEMIVKSNPEYGATFAVRALDEMKKAGIIDSGDTKTLGIGAMSDARWKDFYDTMVKAGDYQTAVDYRAAYTTQFVNKKVGLP